MTEPTSGTMGVVAAIGLISIAPWVDTGALVGACLGAGLVAYNKVDIPPFKRLGALVFSASLGYLLSDEVVALTPLEGASAGAFVGSIAIAPLAVKLMAAISKVDIIDVVKKLGGPR